MNERELLADAEAADREQHMNDFGELLRSVASEDRGKIVAVLGALHAIRQEKNNATKRDAALTQQVKQFLELGGETEIEDGELGVVAWIEQRPGAHVYDLATAAKTPNGMEAIVKAAEMGMLRVDDKALEQFRKKNGGTWADLLYQRYRIPGEGTTALHIATVEEREAKR